MVISAAYVAHQVRKVIERRDKWLLHYTLPLHTIMNDAQKNAFLKELKDEYHSSEDQLRRQEHDKDNKKRAQSGMKQRWSRECQRRGGTTQMFHLLSFSGRWDPAFFNKLPVPQEKGESAEEKKKKTHAASEARARFRLAKKYESWSRPWRSSWLYPDQQWLVEQLQNGTLEREANRLTRVSGNGRIQLLDGTSVDIGGSTGGFTRCTLYDWTPPVLVDVDDEDQ